MYQEKRVGDECPTCGENYIEGKKGPYCKSCYLKWAKENKPQGSQNAPQSPQSHSNQQNVDLSQFVLLTQYNAVLDNQRKAFKLMDDRIKKLESLLANELGMVDELKIPIV